jgi:hypothetical protein
VWDGYNERIQEELDRRHGPGVLSQVRREAAEQWRGLALMVALPTLTIGGAVWWVVKCLNERAGSRM